MKLGIVLFLLLSFAVQPAPAQSTNAPPLPGTNTLSATDLSADSATNNSSALAPPPFATELSREFAPANLAPLEPKPNEVRIGNVRASGIAVEAAKTGNPFSLINPFNPPTNSSPEDNVVRNPFNGKIDGLSIFSIRF